MLSTRSGFELVSPYSFPTAMTIISRFFHHHHHVALVARISLTLSRHSSLSFIALGRSSGQQTDKMKRSFFQAAITSILLYVCTTWTLTKRPEKKLDGSYTRMLRAILNKSWRQHPTRHQLYGCLPPITKTIQVRRTRHAGHCWRSRDELIRDVLLWTPTHGRAKAGRPARTYIQQLCEDTEGSFSLRYFGNTVLHCRPVDIA